MVESRERRRESETEVDRHVFLRAMATGACPAATEDSIGAVTDVPLRLELPPFA